MPNPSQNPTDYGWPAATPDGVNIEPYSYLGYNFANGVARGTSLVWDKVSELVASSLTWDTRTLPPLTAQNVNQWNFWGYEYRAKRGSGDLSIHSWGLANDYNSATNPFNTPNPNTGPYQMSPDIQRKLDNIFGIGAFEWGGAWGDFMHIECHFSPAEIQEWILNFVPTTDWYTSMTTDTKAAFAHAVQLELMSAIVHNDPKNLNHSILETYNNLFHSFPPSNVARHAAVEAQAVSPKFSSGHEC